MRLGSGPVAILAVALFLPAPARADESVVAAGKAFAEANCSPCHAVGADGDSPRDGAPRFRELTRNYPIESLEEALAEGIVTAHPDMPQFEMSPDEIGALIAYLQSIQTQP